jgi:hypothetical protein
VTVIRLHNATFRCAAGHVRTIDLTKLSEPKRPSCHCGRRMRKFGSTRLVCGSIEIHGGGPEAQAAVQRFIAGMGGAR